VQPKFVMLSVAMFEAATWIKSMYMTKSWFKNRKRKKYGNKRNFYIYLHL